MKGRPRTTGARAGFSLLEVAVVLALLSLVMGAIGMAGLSSVRAYRTGTLRVELDVQASRSARRLARELVGSSRQVLLPDPLAPFGTDTLDYQQSVGAAGGVIVWGPPLRIEFQYETGELDDGLDNNGNGSIDEGNLVWTQNPGAVNERSVIWCHGVRECLEGEIPNGLDDNGNGLIDERGLSIDRVGDKLTIRLTLEQRDVDGRLVTRTVETSVRMRN